QRRQLLTLPRVQRVVVRPVSAADVLQRDRGRDALPGCAEVLLRFPDEPGPNLLGNPLPLCTILDRGIRVPLSYGDQGGGQALLAQTTGQQVSRTLTRDDEECREDLHRSWDASGLRRTRALSATRPRSSRYELASPGASKRIE